MPSLIAILGLDGSGFSHGLDHAQHEAEHKGHEIGEALGGKIAMGLTGGAIALALEKEFEASKELAEKALEISRGASRLQVGTDRFQDLEHAAERGKTSLEAVYMAYRKLAQAGTEALNGSKEMENHFAAIGVTLADLRNKSPDELFQKISERTDGATLSARELAAVMKTMGRSADELLPGMKAGLFSEGHDPFRLPAEDVKMLKDYEEQLHVIGQAWGGMKREMTKGFATVMHGLLGDPEVGGVGLISWLRKSFAIAEEKAATPDGDMRKRAEAEALAEREALDIKKELAKEDEKQRERGVRLLEKQRELNLRMLDETMSKTERLKNLEEARKQLLAQTFDMSTAKGRADAQERTNKVTEDSIEIMKLLNEEMTGLRHSKRDVNNLQKIGGYVDTSGATDRMIRDIALHVKQIAGRPTHHDERRNTPGGF